MDRPPNRWQTPLVSGLLGSLICYTAHPPLGLAALAWVGPICWLRLATPPSWNTRRPYLALWLAGCVYWLLTILWLRLPHPANHVALIVLAAYLGLYLPVAIGLIRVAVHRAGCPLWLAAPVIWTGLEGVRARLFTGFSMGSLAHTQTRYPWVIQIADIAGEYGVVFVILLVAGLLTTALPRSPARWRALAGAAAVMAVVLGYGWRQVTTFSDGTQGPLVALIQGNSLADWKGDPDKDRQIMVEHRELSQQAVAAARQASGRAPDLVVWPETMFRQPLVTLDSEESELVELVGEATYSAARLDLATLTAETGAALVVGVDRYAARLCEASPGAAPSLEFDLFNSSVGVNRRGELVGTYDKMHLLPLGEYIPLVEWIPTLRHITPITGLAQPGTHPRALVLDGVTYAPNICYESAVPHLIRRQVKQLADAGERPDVLVNLTNDAWYWGSSELDMHLACGALRSVETRTPMIVAANRGLSGYIDASGRVVESGPRNVATVVLAQLRLPSREALAVGGLSLYVAWGDWLAYGCAAACVVAAMVGWKG